MRAALGMSVLTSSKARLFTPITIPRPRRSNRQRNIDRGT
jgi:hypothetical protein